MLHFNEKRQVNTVTENNRCQQIRVKILDKLRLRIKIMLSKGLENEI